MAVVSQVAEAEVVAEAAGSYDIIRSCLFFYINFFWVVIIVYGQLDNLVIARAFKCIPLLLLFVVPYLILNATQPPHQHR